jgi:hypothetical protein
MFGIAFELSFVVFLFLNFVRFQFFRIKLLSSTIRPRPKNCSSIGVFNTLIKFCSYSCILIYPAILLYTSVILYIYPVDGELNLQDNPRANPMVIYILLIIFFFFIKYISDSTFSGIGDLTL